MKLFKEEEMKRQLTFLLAMTLFLAGCSDVTEGLDTMRRAQASPDDSLAVGFDAYTQRHGSRAGATGSLTTLGLKSAGNLHDAGFGVFGYYTENGRYGSSLVPDYMYNQQVTYNTSNSVFDYTPTKYWPNEATDRLSFFAYAPYVDVERSSGRIMTSGSSLANNNNEDTGITGITSKSEAGDPLVHYVVDTTPANSVDLCWGVASGDWQYEDVSGTTVSKSEGMPLTDLTRMLSRTDRLNLTFLHALAKLNVQIDAYVDGSDLANAVNANTRIFVRSVSFSGFTTQGSLNLNNVAASTPRWLSYGGRGAIGTEQVTFNDGRRNGREGAFADDSEPLPALNASLVESVSWGASGFSAGVTNKTVNLFKSNTVSDPIYVIPNGDPVDVTIVYDVETVDSKLTGHLLSDGVTLGYRSESRITLPALFDKMEAGNAYTLKLHIGLNSVKPDVAVAEWEDESHTSVVYGPIPLAQANIGDKIGTDGYAYSPDAVMPAGVRAVGMVAYLGSDTDVDGYGSYTDKNGVSYSHGLAVSLAACNDGGGIHYPDGVQKRIRSFTRVQGSCNNFRMPRPSEASAWLVPSIDQFSRIFEACGGASFVAFEDMVAGEEGRFYLGAGGMGSFDTYYSRCTGGRYDTLQKCYADHAYWTSNNRQDLTLAYFTTIRSCFKFSGAGDTNTLLLIFAF